MTGLLIDPVLFPSDTAAATTVAAVRDAPGAPLGRPGHLPIPARTVTGTVPVPRLRRDPQPLRTVAQFAGIIAAAALIVGIWVIA